MKTPSRCAAAAWLAAAATVAQAHAGHGLATHVHPHPDDRLLLALAIGLWLLAVLPVLGLLAGRRGGRAALARLLWPLAAAGLAGAAVLLPSLI